MHINTPYIVSHLYVLPLLPIVIVAVLSVGCWLFWFGRWTLRIISVGLHRLARMSGTQLCAF